MKKVLIQIRNKETNYINWEKSVYLIFKYFMIGWVWVNLLRKNEYISIINLF